MKITQESVLNELPSIYVATFQKAYSGKSKSAGVKAFCLSCVGYLRQEVRDCSATHCPLHQYRPYQAKDGGADVEETAETPD